MQDYLPACKIVTTHGVRGEMKALPLCDGAKFLSGFKTLYTGADGSGARRLLGVRAQGNMLLVRLEGVGDMDAARTMVGRTLYLCKGEAKLPKGRFFIDDVIGCEVKDAAGGQVYGKVTEVSHPAAQDVYTVTDPDGGEHMIPVVPEFVQEIDVEARCVLVTPIPGMFDTPVNGDED